MYSLFCHLFISCHKYTVNNFFQTEVLPLLIYTKISESGLCTGTPWADEIAVHAAPHHVNKSLQESKWRDGVIPVKWDCEQTSQLFSPRSGLRGMSHEARCLIPLRGPSVHLRSFQPPLCWASGFQSSILQSPSRGFTPTCCKAGLNWNWKLEPPILRSKQYIAPKFFFLSI